MTTPLCKLQDCLPKEKKVFFKRVTGYFKEIGELFMVARSDVIFSCASLVYLGMTQAGNDLVRGCSLNAACKLATFSPSRQGLCSFRFDDSSTVLKLHSCVFEGFFCGEGETQGVYLHETLQLPWLGDKRPDYSTWHPLVWRCLNIVQSQSDPGLFSFLLSTSPSLPLFRLCSLSCLSFC